MRVRKAESELAKSKEDGLVDTAEGDQMTVERNYILMEKI